MQEHVDVYGRPGLVPVPEVAVGCNIAARPRTDLELALGQGRARGRDAQVRARVVVRLVAQRL